MEPDPIAVGDIVIVTIASSFEQQRYLNVLHFICKNLPTETDYNTAMLDLLSAVEVDPVSSIVPSLRACVAQNVNIDEVRAQRVYPVRNYYVNDEVGDVGEIADDCTAGNLSAVIQKQSIRAGRGRSGSFHIAGLPANAYVAGTLTAEYQNLMAELADRIDGTQVTGAGGTNVWYPGMYNPHLGAGQNWSDLVRTLTHNTVRVMRRRTLGVGI